MNKSALILSYHFYPSAEIGARRPSELAHSLQQSGWTVTAMAARSRRKIRIDPGLQSRADTLQITRVTDPPSLEAWLVRWVKKILGRGGGESGKWELAEPAPGAAEQTAVGREPLIARCKRYYFSMRYLFGHNKAWALLSFLRLIPLAWRRDLGIILSSGPPMPAHIIALAISRIFRIKLVMDMRDPWFLGELAPPQYQSALRSYLDNAMERLCYRKAHLIVCTSPGAARHIAMRCPGAESKLCTVLNGYDAVPKSSKSGPVGELRLLYAGAIYFNRNPFPLFEALEALLNEPEIDRNKVSFKLFGHCAEWQGIQIAPWLEERGLQDVIEVHGAVEKSEVMAQTAQANVLVNFAQGQPNQIPAKTFEQLVAGRETLVIAEADSDTAQVIRDSGTGMVVPQDDGEQMVATLRELYTRYVVRREIYSPPADKLENFSRACQNQLYVAQLEQLLSHEQVT